VSFWDRAVGVSKLKFGFWDLGFGIWGFDVIQFAVALPWWVLAVIGAAVIAVAWLSYAGSLLPLPPARRRTLVALRAAALLLIVACLLRPIRVLPPNESHDAVVPLLVDVSRSMRLADADGRARIDAARDLVRRTLGPSLAARFRSELWTFGDTLDRGQLDTISADASSSDLSGALRSIRDRYRDRRVAGIVVVSDGGDTGTQDAAASVDPASVPVYTIGIGSPRPGLDYEVLDVTAGEATLADASVDLTVSAIGRGTNAPFDIRILQNGNPIDVRHVTPAASGGPVRAVFTVSPTGDTATLYTVEIPSAAGEPVAENNRRSVVVEPPGRRRRLLMIEGAPGFEHSFIKRALVADPALELDSVVRKGRDTSGDSTYFVQADTSRAPLLAPGFPNDRAALYRYDAIVLANVEPDALSAPQLTAVADFVNRRGGGLLVFGAKSFAQQGLVGTAIEEVLPLNVSARGSTILLTAGSLDDAKTDVTTISRSVSGPRRRRGGEGVSVLLTEEGESHPVMRIGATPEEMSKRWSAVPSLSGMSLLGAPRPGAQVLAVVRAPEGARPLVAVQRYGQGRSMIFAGEASFRWRMQLPSNDNTFELFWRQAARWLSSSAPEPVAIVPPRSIAPGETAPIAIDVRNESFSAVGDAQVAVKVTAPGGRARDIKVPLADARAGRYSADVKFDEPGVYHITADVRRGGRVLGNASRWILAGGSEREFADPRLNEDVLRRVSRASGGRYLSRSEIEKLPSLLASADPVTPAPRVQELWQNVWVYVAIIALLSMEWVLRRHWGLR